jgi:tetratricopeptide (TPR) repeat protein
LKINPENVPALAALGWAKAELESYDESLDAFHAGLSLDPNNAVLLHHIGTVLSDTGHAEGARAMFLDALRSDPNYDDAAINIAGLQYRTTLLYRFHYWLVSLFRDSHISRILFFCGVFLFLQSIAEPSWENHMFWGKLLVGTAWFFLLILLAVFIVPAAGNLPVIFEGKYRHLYTGKAKLKTVLIFLLYIASIGCLAAMLFSNGLAARSFMYASLILLLSSLVVQALLGSGQTLWGSVIMLFLAGCLFTWLYLTSKGVIGYGNGFYGGWLGIGSNVVTLGFAGFKKFSD